MSGKAEVQHYVPKLLLRLHVNNPGAKRGSEQVWCFDKKTEKVFSPNIAGVLAQTGYNEIESDGFVASLEGALSKLEAQVAPMLAKVARDRSVAKLTGMERAGIAAFCAVQFVRTPSFREHVRSLNEAVVQAFEEKGIAPEEMPGVRRWTKDEVDEFALTELPDAALKYGPHFLNKHWYLIEGTADDPFHLGDHPVVRANDFGGPPGLGSPGVTIYLPLTPTLCLTMSDANAIEMLCREFDRGKRRIRIAEKRNEKWARKRGSSGPVTAELAQARELLDGQESHVRAIRNGRATPYNPEVVMHMNSLQMIYATRWVVSSRNDYTLPRRMLADNEAYRKGVTIDGVEIGRRASRAESAVDAK